MGQEHDCNLRYGRRTFAGKALLETDYLLFRGPERLKIAFKDLKAVTAAAGVLRLEFDGGPAELELGRAAEKWADKILHPPSRLDKLGVKPGLRVRLEGDFEESFLTELAARAPETVAGRARADLVFFAAPAAAALGRVPKLATLMQPEGALWIVYPKGGKGIREVEVIQAGRDAGLKDVKVASFSPTHTALKFVVPLAAR